MGLFDFLQKNELPEGMIESTFECKREGLTIRGTEYRLALCIPDDARAGKMMMAKFDPTNVPEQLNCGPMKLGKCYVTDVLNIDPFQEIKSYNGQVCIVHGTADKIVNIDYAKRAEEAYKSTKPEDMEEEKRVRLHIIEGGGHAFSKKHDVIAMEKIKEFIGD